MQPDIAAIRRVLARRPTRDLTRDAARHAAVAAVVREMPELEVLLIRRAEKASDPWSGHIAFPGGRHEERDPDLLATARRETAEEIGVDLEAHAELLGRLDDVQAIAKGERLGMVIRPYVFRLERDVSFRPNEEVAEVLWTPLGPLLRREWMTTRPTNYAGAVYDLPAHRIGGALLWGLTYHMLELLLGELRDEAT